MTETEREAGLALITQHFLRGVPNDEAARAILHDVTVHRVTEFRNNVLPWLNRYAEIGTGTRVLEIGAGSGASVCVLAETGAEIDGIDILDGHLDVARWQLAWRGLTTCTLHHRNATEIGDLYDRPYDLILFSAVLEHMTYEERLKALSEAWANLRPGGALCVYETPNRLWFRDSHTALLNFYAWLPDELALLYASRSPRTDFAENFVRPQTTEKLARWGRGASYHEWDLAIGLQAMTIGDSLNQHLSDLHPSYAERRDAEPNGTYRRLIRALEPSVPDAFFEEVLDVVAIKPGG